MPAVRKKWLMAVLLCACLTSATQAAILPTDLEARVGADYEPADADERAIWQDLARLEEGIRTSPQRLVAPELDAYIRGVIERLIGRPAPDLRIYVMRDASLNAAMLPSGMMIVNTGLLVRVRDEAQLAAVLAHEAGHYFRRHALDLYRADRRKSALASSTRSALNCYNETQPGWCLIIQAMTFSSFRFSRDLESEADAYGLMLMARSGYRPRAALEIWEQFTSERQASAAARHTRYHDGTNSELSTHPPTHRRMTNLADTAEYLAGKHQPQTSPNRDEWAAVSRPHQAMLLREQIYLNDTGASLYLLANQAKDGWTAPLRFGEGEIYRLRNAKGDALKASSAYAAATTLAGAPAEAWRAHGYALLKSGRNTEAHEAMNQYLAMSPQAADATLIRLVLSQPPSTDERSVAGDRITVKPGPEWKRLHAGVDEAPWEEWWTWHGPQVDRMALLDGLPDGEAIMVREKTADPHAPVFRADMTAQDLASLLEVSYRLRGVTVFNIESVEAVDFLGGPGVELRYDYASGIVFPKRGRCVLRVMSKKLYAMKLEGVANPSFDAVAADFDRLVRTARLRK
ncbi:MAG TPA: M48 family metalloprotease [Steroidobacteraceae bacterium]|nr:M48 family metalloprotease [Steroidobacteraceae bacterium]